MSKNIKAPLGSEITCKGWIQEAAMRMLMNNLDKEVAENPDELIVYGGIGKAARNWKAYENIIDSLKTLNNDQTLLVQSGKPVGILRTHIDAPRVIIANSNIVPKWATWEHFRELDKKGLIMYGQMTAGSWIYIGTQGIIQGTYETFMSAGRIHFPENKELPLKGKIILTAGLGGMGGAQPLAGVFAGAVCLVVEVDNSRIKRRLETGYLDEVATSVDDAIKKAKNYKTAGIARSIAILGNAADIYWQIYNKGLIPDLVTDQTSAHDELNGYIPEGFSIDDAAKLRKENPVEYINKSLDSIAKHVNAMLKFKDSGSFVFDYGNNIRAKAQMRGVENAFDFHGFVPLYIRPLFCKGNGPFRLVALSGDKNDIYECDAALIKAFPENKSLIRWLDLAKDKIKFQGLPARICWLGYGEREKAGWVLNNLVRKGKVSAPIVIGRDHLDSGSVASPNRETEGMKDGSDTIADWPILNALINSINGASWVSLHHGGGVGMGYSVHAGMVIVADGTIAADTRLERVLNSDPGMGLLRHADAGYEDAINEVKRADPKKIRIPGIK